MNQNIEKLNSIYMSFCSEMTKNGKKTKYSRIEDFNRTYTGRYISKFYDRVVNDWQFGEDSIPLLLSIVVKCAKKKNVLQRGSAILIMNDLLDLCLKELEDLKENDNEFIVSLKDMRSKIGNYNCEYLTKSERIGGYPNIVKLYEEGLVSDAYLALSKTFYKSLAKIAKEDRKILPTNIQLLKIRTRILNNKDISGDVCSIFGKDLALVGMVGYEI